MARIIKYCVIDYLKLFVLLLFVFGSLFSVYEILLLLEVFTTYKASFFDMLGYIIRKIPECLFWSIPMSTLLSSIFVMGKMTKTNEVVAVKSMGLNLRCLPISLFCLNVVSCLLLIYFGFEAVPVSKFHAKRIIEFTIKKRKEIKERIKYNVSYKLGNRIILAKSIDVEKKELNDVLLETFTLSGEISNQILSKRMRLENNSVILYDVYVRDFKNRTYKKIRELKLDLKLRVEDFLPIEKNIEEFTTKELTKELKYHDKKSSTFYKMSTQIYFRSFYPLINISVGLLGNAIGLMNNYTHIRGFGVGIIIIVSYYTFISLGYSLSDNGIINPFLGCFLPIAITLLIGVISFLKIKT